MLLLIYYGHHHKPTNPNTQRLAGFCGFTRPLIGNVINGKIAVSVLPFESNRHKVVLWATSLDEAEAMRDTLRRVIEIRLGGEALNWE